MAAIVLEGKPLAERLRSEIAEQTAAFVARTGVTPCLAAVLVGDDPASQVYVRNKQKACEKAGIRSRMHHLPAETGTGELLDLIARLNEDADVHGILVQLPLPESCDEKQVLDAVSPLKDVDAFHPENVGLLMQGRPRFLPCTPNGCLQFLLNAGIETRGAEVVIVGRSDIVGKPLAAMLIQKGRGGDATVTVCHSRTRDLPAVVRRADILVVAIGRPRFITGEMVKPGATVIDVGINRVNDRLVGDVDFDSVAQVAGAITPVPGGVGLLTVTMLLKNTLTAAELQTAR